MPAFCTTENDIIEIHVQTTALEVEGLSVAIFQNIGGKELVAQAKADDMEKPSSLSVFYEAFTQTTAGVGNSYTVEISSTDDAVIPAKSL